MENGENLETDTIPVRTLEERDFEMIVRIDAAAIGRRRTEYYRDKLQATLRDTRPRMSVVAEIGGQVVGFLMADVHYGEFGRPEPIAVLDSIGVHPEYREKHVGATMMRQFLANARALGVTRIRTEVAWNDHGLIGFLDAQGFAPGTRLVLERAL